MMNLIPRHRPRLVALVALVILAMTAAACGSTEPQSVPIEQTKFADTTHVDLARSTKLASGMYVRDTVIGTGAVVSSGQTVSVRYVGFLANGSIFDQNPAPKALFTFKLGGAQVIPGFDIGIQGMKVGGKRQLIIPPELGYGSSGAGSIPPYAVLVFFVDVISAT